MNKRKVLGTIIGIALYVFCIIFFTYAFYSWRSSNSGVSLNITEQNLKIEFITGTDVNAINIGPVLDYNDGVSTTFSISNPLTTDLEFNVILDITTISDNLKNETFKYILLVDTSGGTNYTEEVTSGNFLDFDIGSNTILQTELVSANSTYSYKFIVYIDGNVRNDNNLQNNTLESNLIIVENSSKIMFNPNGGVVDITKKNITFGSEYGELPTPTRNGYTFEGWFTDIDEGEQITSESIVTPDAVEILYARWRSDEIPISSITTTSTLKKTTQTATLTCTGNDLEVTSYYWGTDSTPSDSDYTSGTPSTKTVSSAGKYYLFCKNTVGNISDKVSKTYYSYTINNLLETVYGVTGTYTSDNYKSASTGSYIVPSGTNLTLASVYTAPTGSSSSTFKGYSTSYGTTASTLSTTVPTITDGSTYYMWFNRLTYVLTLNRGTGISNVTGAGTYKYEETVTISATPSSGYSFKEWRQNSNLYATTSITTVTMTGDRTYTAYSTANPYTVTFNANGGSVTPTSKTVTYASTYGTLPTASRTGYDFDGWFTSASGGTKVTSSSTVSITADQTLYAHWSARDYLVTFNANGGSVTPTSKTVTYASTYETLPTPTRSNYSFDGWYTAASGGTKVTSSSTVSITAGQTLYAHWNPLIILNYQDNVLEGISNWIPDNSNTYINGLEGYSGQPAMRTSSVGNDEGFIINIDTDKLENTTNRNMQLSYSILRKSDLAFGYEFMVDLLDSSGNYIDELRGSYSMNLPEGVQEREEYDIFDVDNVGSVHFYFDTAGDGPIWISDVQLNSWEKIGGTQLPKPEREGYNFDGWYNIKDTPTIVTDTSSLLSSRNNRRTMMFNLEYNTTYVVSMKSASLISGSATQFEFKIEKAWDSDTSYSSVIKSFGDNISFEITTPPASDDSNSPISLVFYAGLRGSTANNIVKFTDVWVRKKGDTKIRYCAENENVGTNGCVEPNFTEETPLYAHWTPNS